MTEEPERYKRQLSIFDPRQFEGLDVAIVGVGAIGSCAAVVLAKLGFKNFVLYDFDTIEEHNLSNQFFRNNQLGKLKTEATKELIEDYGEDCQVEVRGKVEEDTLIMSPIVIVCTDNMAIRKLVYEKAQMATDLFIDARMGGQMFRVYTIQMSKDGDKEFYEGTLYDDADAVQLPCTERSIMFNLFGVASVIGGNLTKALHKDPYFKEVCFDYVNMVVVKNE